MSLCCYDTMFLAVLWFFMGCYTSWANFGYLSVVYMYIKDVFLFWQDSVYVCFTGGKWRESLCLCAILQCPSACLFTVLLMLSYASFISLQFPVLFPIICSLHQTNNTQFPYCPWILAVIYTLTGLSTHLLCLSLYRYKGTCKATRITTSTCLPGPALSNSRLQLYRAARSPLTLLHPAKAVNLPSNTTNTTQLPSIRHAFPPTIRVHLLHSSNPLIPLSSNSIHDPSTQLRPPCPPSRSSMTLIAASATTRTRRMTAATTLGATVPNLPATTTQK